MADIKGGAKGKPVAKKTSKGIYSLYGTSGNKLDRKNPTCPKCGNGVFMGRHKDRMTCGKCHYTEFGSKK
ncbi:MAG: 30S ribosomal protein S27ae, small subunit ribosomal protein S27Ae [archaeon GW2011_AR3]|nr:MAG: 30S ribosomal protein S27ae, small subunit ribosomal protein S27Ae [archaeon GW2011_AR3]